MIRFLYGRDIWTNCTYDEEEGMWIAVLENPSDENKDVKGYGLMCIDAVEDLIEKVCDKSRIYFILYLRR